MRAKDPFSRERGKRQLRFLTQQWHHSQKLGSEVEEQALGRKKICLALNIFGLWYWSDHPDIQLEDYNVGLSSWPNNWEQFIQKPFLNHVT